MQGLLIRSHPTTTGLEMPRTHRRERRIPFNGGSYDHLPRGNNWDNDPAEPFGPEPARTSS